MIRACGWREAQRKQGEGDDNDEMLMTKWLNNNLSHIRHDYAN